MMVRRWGLALRLGASALAWLAWLASAFLVTAMPAVFGVDVGHAGPTLEHQLEQKGAMPAVQPERSHDDSGYEPWDLVKV